MNSWWPQFRDVVSPHQHEQQQQQQHHHEHFRNSLLNSSALSLEIKETSWRGNTFLSTVPVKHGTRI
jgi:hypothetical protein